MNFKHLFPFLFIAFLYSCSVANNEQEQIKKLVELWIKVDPNNIGGPYEMRGIKEVKKIDVGEVSENKWAKMGCKDCKQAIVTLACIDKVGNQQNIVYKLRKEDNMWFISEWELVGKEQGTFNPNINETVIEARGESK